MLRKRLYAHGSLMLPALLLCAICRLATAQDNSKSLDPNDPRLNYSFPVQYGGTALRFKVGLNKAGHVTGISVFHAEGSAPFQTLPRCAIIDIPEPASEEWEAYGTSKLLTHADLNFDGFEDLELLTYSIPHLNKKMYCTYLWDNKTGRFRYSNALSELAVNPVPHPADKTITMREDWQGGLWTESTYGWNGERPELIEQNSLLEDGSLQSNQKCRFTFTCSRLVSGTMTITLVTRVCSTGVQLPDCPASGSPSTVHLGKKDSSADSAHHRQ